MEYWMPDQELELHAKPRSKMQKTTVNLAVLQCYYSFSNMY